MERMSRIAFLKTKYMALLMACVANLFWGCVTTPTFYVNTIKAQYNFSQVEVEVIPITMTFGKLTVPLAAMMYDGLRPYFVTLTGMLCGSGGLFLMWSSVHYIQVCHNFPVIIFTFFFMMGLGNAFMTFGLLTTVCKNFAKRGSGKAVSTLLTCYAVSPIVMLFVYRKWFSVDPLVDSSNDISGFTLFMGITTLASGFLSVCLVREYPEDDNDEVKALIEEKKKLKLESMDTKLDPDEAEDKVQGWCKKHDQFLHWPFHLLMWSYALCDAVYYGYHVNVAVIAKSSGNYASSDYCFFTFQSTIIVSRLLTGFISDTFDGIIPRMWYAAITSSLVMVSLFLFIYFPSAVFSLYLLFVFTGIMGGVGRTLIVTVFVNKLGKENFAWNWGITTFVTCVMTDLWLLAYSGFYELARGDNSVPYDCHGSSCTLLTNVTSSVLLGIATVFSFILAFVKRF